MIEPLLMTSVRINTFAGGAGLTSASGFFFQRDGRLYLVTSRHVFHDEASGHWPDRIEIEIHTNADDLAKSTGFSIPLYRDQQGLWKDAEDSGGAVDVAALEIDQGALPASTVFRAFTPDDIIAAGERVPIGATLLAVGYPMGFEDTLHHLPVARHATLASSFGLRFKGKGYFLVDARTHRGISGAPVVMRDKAMPDDGAALGWKLLGIHSARLESGTRDPALDETLGLNSIWYADVLMTLTVG
jgi:S1-C subfamily serine protease